MAQHCGPCLFYFASGWKRFLEEGEEDIDNGSYYCYFSSASVSHRPETGSCLALVICKVICFVHLEHEWILRNTQRCQSTRGRECLRLVIVFVTLVYISTSVCMILKNSANLVRRSGSRLK
jgi:hypothetical protein